MSNRQKSEGQSAFEAGSKRADNPYTFGTHDWTDWKDGFDQAEAIREQIAIREHVAEKVLGAG